MSLGRPAFTHQTPVVVVLVVVVVLKRGNCSTLEILPRLVFIV